MRLRRSQRERRSAILNYYYVYLQEHEFDIGIDHGPMTLCQEGNSVNFSQWMEAMQDELKSMQNNEVSDLVRLPNAAKIVEYKWIFKTKRDSKGNVERLKARLVEKWSTQREGIDFNETFSPISMKESFRFILAMVAQF